MNRGGEPAGRRYAVDRTSAAAPAHRNPGSPQFCPQQSRTNPWNLRRRMVVQTVMSSKRLQPWPEYYVGSAMPSADDLAILTSIIHDARSEQPLQEFLASKPSSLRCLVPPAPDVWVFDRRKFGSEFIPDFLLAFRNSAGMNWRLVELESPTAQALTGRGRPAAKLNEALAQIRDWRIWLRKNISYAHAELGLRQIDAEAPGMVIIGRRGALQPANAARYRELSNENVTVMSYDRLVDMVSARRSDSAV